MVKADNFYSTCPKYSIALDWTDRYDFDDIFEFAHSLIRLEHNKNYRLSYIEVGEEHGVEVGFVEVKDE